jgi:hypothetical protein
MKEGGEDRAAYRRAPGEGDKERGIAFFSKILSFFSETLSFFRKPCSFFGNPVIF